VSGGINAGTYYVHGDHLGSLNVLTNSQGAEVQRLTYRPFGETQSTQGSADFLQHRFTGQELDPETGLYFYNARYYNPVLGRFISPDSIVPEPGNPQSLNRYSYVGNNPVNRIDPSGHSWLSKFFRSVPRSLPGMFVQSFVTAITLNPVLGAAAGGAVNMALYGGNLGRNIGISVAGGAIAGAAYLVAGPLGGALGAQFGEFAGGLATAALMGAAVGGASAAIAGGNILEGIAGGAITAAALYAAIYAGQQLYTQITSPALDESGGPPNWGAPRRPASEYPRDLPTAETSPLEEGLRIIRGYRAGHYGLDAGSPPRSWPGETVYTTDAGGITGIGTERSGINYITLTTNHGVEVTYMHVTRLGYLTEGMRVTAGQGIGVLDNSGQAAGRWTGYHVHLQTIFEGKYFNPRFYLGY
jgi:RHS repeat-associated protein